MPSPTDWVPLSDLEAAIDHWRTRCPAQPGQPLPAPWAALAQCYAQSLAQAVCGQEGADSLPPGPNPEGSEGVAWDALPTQAQQAWLAWYATTPDTPCIAVCSTAQGDAQCKGCGRSFEEVRDWPAMGPVHKRMVWWRIRTDASALRFTRYAERG
ncbi:MAG: DUF1289 domain-containing protein [Rhodoferax sp.]